MLNDFQFFQKSSGGKGSMAHVARPLCITPLIITLGWTQVSEGPMQVGPQTCPFFSTMNYIQDITFKQVRGMLLVIPLLHKHVVQASRQQVTQEAVYRTQKVGCDLDEQHKWMPMYGHNEILKNSQERPIILNPMGFKSTLEG